MKFGHSLQVPSFSVVKTFPGLRCVDICFARRDNFKYLLLEISIHAT